MDLATIEMAKPKARQAFLEYRAALREGHVEHERETVKKRLAEVDEAVMRGYRELARGRQLLQLSETLRAGGLTDVPSRRWDYTDRRSYAADQTVTSLAITRADAQLVFTGGVRQDGSVSFIADNAWSRRSRRHIDLPARTFEPIANNPSEHIRAIVPTVPPMFRPPHRLENYHILFEPTWQSPWGVDELDPADPALLKHIGGDLYAILAVWDLTPLEAAAIGQATARGRRA
jgi:hypothetical protein